MRRSCWLFLYRTSTSSSSVGHQRQCANILLGVETFIVQLVLKLARLLTTITFCSILEEIRTPSKLSPFARSTQCLQVVLWQTVTAGFVSGDVDSNRRGGQVISWKVTAGGFCKQAHKLLIDEEARFASSQSYPNDDVSKVSHIG